MFNSDQCHLEIGFEIGSAKGTFGATYYFYKNNHESETRKPMK